MRIVGLCGAAGTGKDTVARLLPARQLAFADALYSEVAQAFGVSVEWLGERSRKEQPQDCLATYLCADEGFCRYLRWSGKTLGAQAEEQPRSPRQILQWWGDYRRAQDPNYFLYALQIALHPAADTVVTDVRFPNEAALIRSLGGELWQITRPGVDAGGTGHRSDTAGDEFHPEYHLRNDGSLATLRRAAQCLWARS